VAEKRHCQHGGNPDDRGGGREATEPEPQNLVTEQRRIINQIKAIFARFGLPHFAPDHAQSLPKGSTDLPPRRKGTPLPQNTLSELRRHSRAATLRTRPDPCGSNKNACASSRWLRRAPRRKAPDAMGRLIAAVFGAGIENGGHAGQRRDLLAPLRIARPSPATPRLTGSARRERQPSNANGVLRGAAMSRPLRHDSRWLGVLLRFQKTAALAQWFAGGEPPTDAPAHAKDDDRGAGA